MTTGVEWKPIRTTGNSYRKKDPLDSSERFYALDLECVRPSTRSMEEDAHLVRLYIEKNLDDTNMPLVPTFNSVLSDNKTKFASCLVCQAALSSGLGTCTSWEMSTNLLLDPWEIPSETL
jgi:hypothetical protein